MKVLTEYKKREKIITIHIDITAYKGYLWRQSIQP